MMTEQKLEQYTKVVLEGTEEQIEKTLDEYRSEGIEYIEIDNVV